MRQDDLSDAWMIERCGLMMFVVTGPGIPVAEYTFTRWGARRIVRRHRETMERGSVTGFDVDYPGLRGRHASGS